MYSAVSSISAREPTEPASTAPSSCVQPDSRRVRHAAKNSASCISRSSSTPARPARKVMRRISLSTKFWSSAGTSEGITVPVPKRNRWSVVREGMKNWFQYLRRTSIVCGSTISWGPAWNCWLKRLLMTGQSSTRPSTAAINIGPV